jgi:hypothetical protein
MVVVTSEETGGITLFIDGTLHRNLDANSLKDLLERNSLTTGRPRRGILKRMEVSDGEG